MCYAYKKNQGILEHYKYTFPAVKSGDAKQIHRS